MGLFFIKDLFQCQFINVMTIGLEVSEQKQEKIVTAGIWGVIL